MGLRSHKWNQWVYGAIPSGGTNLNYFLWILDIYIILIDSHAKFNVYHEEARDSTHC